MSSAKTVQVDETAFLAQQKLTSLFEQMNANPKARDLLLQAAKVVNPNVATPEADAKAEVYAALSQRDEKIAALQKQMEDDKAARDLEKQQASFISSWNEKKSGLRRQGYTDEGLEKIEKFAEERGLADLEAAEALFAKLNPPASINEPAGGANGFDFFQPSTQDDTDFKKLLESQGDDPAAERAMINKALSEFRTGRS